MTFHVIALNKSAMLHYITLHEALPFWGSRHTTYPRLAPLAEDLIAAPASQAYVERIFSLCGELFC